ncbi:MAG TPA: porin [Gemmatirosa sp.]
MPSHPLARCLAFGALCVVAAAPARAQDASPKLDLHGYGSWSYGRTSDDNVYLGGANRGDYRLANFALNTTLTAGRHLRADAQAECNTGDDAELVEIDFAFAEYKFSDQLRLRAGQVKQPFGIYTEVYDVGTLRPFLSLPQGVYGPVGFAGEAYRGLGLTGRGSVGRGWTVDYDAYVGGQKLMKYHAPEAYYRGESLASASDETESETTRDMVGARAVLTTPVDGLSVGASAYTGTVADSVGHRRTVGGAQIEYLHDRWTLRSELAHQVQVHDELATGGYIEAAYAFTTHWQGALLYDRLRNTFAGVNAARAPSLERHDEGVAGINYWLSPTKVVKLDVHRVSGNRLSTPDPERLAEVIESGQLRTHTTLVRFGAQFSF